MDLKGLKNYLLEDVQYQSEQVFPTLKKEIALMVFEGRLKVGMTQSELAAAIGTQQPSIARVENGSVLPSLAFLEKTARAFGTTLVAPRYAFIESKDISVKNVGGGSIVTYASPVSEDFSTVEVCEVICSSEGSSNSKYD
jgi:transcriptional regulator with XRE-family HTH domain